jgi:hypothetical protein
MPIHTPPKEELGFTDEDRHMLERHDRAIFGNGKDDAGMKQKIDEMSDILKSIKWAGKAGMFLIIGAGALALAFTQIGKFVQFFFNKKL